MLSGYFLSDFVFLWRGNNYFVVEKQSARRSIVLFHYGVARILIKNFYIFELYDSVNYHIHSGFSFPYSESFYRNFKAGILIFDKIYFLYNSCITFIFVASFIAFSCSYSYIAIISGGRTTLPCSWSPDIVNTSKKLSYVSNKQNQLASVSLKCFTPLYCVVICLLRQSTWVLQKLKVRCNKHTIEDVKVGEKTQVSASVKERLQGLAKKQRLKNSHLKLTQLVSEIKNNCTRRCLRSQGKSARLNG